MAALGAVGTLLYPGLMAVPVLSAAAQDISKNPIVASLPGGLYARVWSVYQGVIAGQCVDQDGITPAYRLVRIYHRASGALAASGYSDPVTGLWQLRVDEPLSKYTVILLPIAVDEDGDGMDDILPRPGV